MGGRSHARRRVLRRLHQAERRAMLDLTRRATSPPRSCAGSSTTSTSRSPTSTSRRPQGSKARSAAGSVAGQAEVALGDDVPEDLARAAVDGRDDGGAEVVLELDRRRGRPVRPARGAPRRRGCRSRPPCATGRRRTRGPPPPGPRGWVPPSRRSRGRRRGAPPGRRSGRGPRRATAGTSARLHPRRSDLQVRRIAARERDRAPVDSIISSWKKTRFLDGIGRVPAMTPDLWHRLGRVCESSSAGSSVLTVWCRRPAAPRKTPTAGSSTAVGRTPCSSTWTSMGSAIDETSKRTEALLDGRRTFQVMAGVWPVLGAGRPVRRHGSTAPKNTSSPTRSTIRRHNGWRPTLIIRGAYLTPAINAMSPRCATGPGGEVNVWGSSQRCVRRSATGRLWSTK